MLHGYTRRLRVERDDVEATCSSMGREKASVHANVQHPAERKNTKHDYIFHTGRGWKAIITLRSVLLLSPVGLCIAISPNEGGQHQVLRYFEVVPRGQHSLIDEQRELSLWHQDIILC